MSDGRNPESVLRSLKRYVAAALGPQWEVRLSREEGAFARPFARVVQAGPATYPTNGGQFVADVIQPFAIYAYPPRGATPDDALFAAQTIEDALYQAFRAGVEDGKPLRVPLFNYTDVGLGQPGVWFPKDFVKVQALSTQPFVDPDDNTLWTVTCDVRLAWRRTAGIVSSGLPVTGVPVTGGLLPGPDIPGWVPDDGDHDEDDPGSYAATVASSASVTLTTL